MRIDKLDEILKLEEEIKSRLVDFNDGKATSDTIILQTLRDKLSDLRIEYGGNYEKDRAVYDRIIKSEGYADRVNELQYTLYKDLYGINGLTFQYNFLQSKVKELESKQEFLEDMVKILSIYAILQLVIITITLIIL